MRIVATTGRDSRVGDDVQCVIALYGNRTLTGSFMRTACTFVVMLSLVAVADVARAAQVGESVDGLLPARALPLNERAMLAPALVVSESPSRRDELQQWMNEFEKWKAWSEQWGNRREPGWFHASRQRRPRPDPPSWLFERCVVAPDDTDIFEAACSLLAEWNGDLPTSHIAATMVQQATADEEGDKTTWWEHVHLEAGWPAMQSGVSLYGVIGMHATTTVHGRFQMFVAPGAMLLNVPTSDGGRAWKLASNYGIAYRLGQFKFMGRTTFLHLNFAKAWLFSIGPDVPTKSTDFAGLSFTFKKKE
jgi:hypothetical protein